jgi:hypothetical protein
LDPHLKCLHDQIQTLTAELSVGELSWHPPAKWCTAEILEHLYLTYGGTSKGLSRVLESGIVKKCSTLKQRVAALLVVGWGYFPSGVKSPVVVSPKGIPAEKIMAEIGSKIKEMDAIMASCEAQFGARVKVLEHPLLGPFSIAQWRKFHLRHGMHHLKQIRRLRQLMRQTAPLESQ